jgi:Protein of unknown function (DUF3037)
MKTAYTYTTLRYVHDTATGEFANVGVALYAPDAKFLSARFRTTYGRLSKMFPGLDGEVFKSLMRHLENRFEEIGAAIRDELPLNGHPKSAIEIAVSVLPRDDSSLQWTEVGSGITDNPSTTLETIYERMVDRYEQAPNEAKRNDEAVWRKYKHDLEQCHVIKYFSAKIIAAKDDEFEFQHSWKNQQWHCVEPVSFDLLLPDSIREKAHRWLGQISSLRDSTERFKIYMLLGEPQDSKLKSAFIKAQNILNKIPGEKEFVHESESAAFARHFAAQIKKHEGKV